MKTVYLEERVINGDYYTVITIGNKTMYAYEGKYIKSFPFKDEFDMTVDFYRHKKGWRVVVIDNFS